MELNQEIKLLILQLHNNTMDVLLKIIDANPRMSIYDFAEYLHNGKFTSIEDVEEATQAL